LATAAMTDRCAHVVGGYHEQIELVAEGLPVKPVV
jgi:hypothetical protein